MTTPEEWVGLALVLAIVYGIGWTMGHASGEACGFRRACRARWVVMRRAQRDLTTQLRVIK